MTGLVERLRHTYENWGIGSKGPAILTEAADEIERLRAENASLRAGIKRLSDEEELCAETTGDDPFSLVYLAAKLAAAEARENELVGMLKDADESRVAQIHRAMSAEEENASLREQVEKAREALEPFAKVGKLIDGPFGPALFADDDGAFQSGCGWTEDGEKKTLTWGDFRRARDARRAAGRTE